MPTLRASRQLSKSPSAPIARSLCWSATNITGSIDRSNGMNIIFRLFLGLAAAMLVGKAGNAADYKFHLYNKTTKYTIKGFQTYENDEWRPGAMSLSPLGRIKR